MYFTVGRNVLKTRKEDTDVIQISINKKGLRAATVHKIVEDAIKAVYPDASVTTTRKEPAESRADRLGEAESGFDDAKSTVEELRDEMQEWYNNMPENFQSGDKGDEVQSTVEALEEIISNMEQVDFSSVDFPSMM